MTPDSVWPPSLWADVTPARTPAPPLSDSAEADVVVIGGGLSGLSIAYHLSARGTQVLLLEGAEVGWGASGRSNGQVIPTLSGVEPDAIVKRQGETGERFVSLVAQSAEALFRFAESEDIACEAEQTGWLQPAHSAGRMRLSESRVRAWRRFGGAAELLDRASMASMIGSNFWHGGMFNPTGGHINPLALVRGLAAACERKGVRIHECTTVTGYRRENDGWRISTAGGSVRARAVALATNAYTDVLAPSLDLRIAHSIVPLLSWQMATPPLDDELRGQLLRGRQAVSDTRADLRFFRYDAGNRLVTGGSVLGSHDAARRVAAHVSRRMAEAFPDLAGTPFTHVWSGRIGITRDRQPHIHRLGPDFWSWVGCNGRGVALALALGRELAAAIDGAPANELALPITDVDPLPFHSIARRIAPFVLAWHKRRDQSEPKST